MTINSISIIYMIIILYILLYIFKCIFKCIQAYVWGLQASVYIFFREFQPMAFTSGDSSFIIRPRH